MATGRSLDIYLKAVKGEVAELDTDVLMQIGELAKAVKETVPTIRHWTNAGLLEVAEVTPSGYHLYDASTVKRVANIKKLQSERFTLAEIKKRLL